MQGTPTLAGNLRTVVGRCCQSRVMLCYVWNRCALCQPPHSRLMLLFGQLAAASVSTAGHRSQEHITKEY